MKYPELIPLVRKDDNLLIIEKQSWPFVVNRVFFIQNVKRLGIRGNHAHKSCSQFLFPLSGAVDIDVLNTRGTGQYTIEAAGLPYGLLVPPMNWVKLRILRAKTVIAVMCSQEYDESDYVRDIKVYTEWLKNEQNTIQQLGASNS